MDEACRFFMSIWFNSSGQIPKKHTNTKLEHQLGNRQKFPDKATFFVRVVLGGLLALGNPEKKKTKTGLQHLTKIKVAVPPETLSI